MKKIFRVLTNLCIKSFWVLSLASLIFAAGLLTPQYVYAASKTAESEEIIQPLELTKPAETREDAYEEVAKLTENPKELIKAQNKEEKAQEKVLKK